MIRLVLVIGFLFAFSAGLVVGLQVRREAAAAPATRPTRHGFLTAELGLSPDQEEQLKKIWSETAHRGGREQEDRRRQFRKERDEAVAALIKAQDRDKYVEAINTYTKRTDALQEEWRSSFQSAVEKTKQILTPEQRTKYEDLLKRQEAERSSRDREQGRKVDDRATSRPVPGK